MSHVVHHAIAATTWKKPLAAEAVAKARDLGLACSDACEAKVNGYWSFCVFPDGSTEGREESNSGDVARAAFKDWLRSNPGVEWVEVAYGDDAVGCGYAPSCESHAWDGATASSPTASR